MVDRQHPTVLVICNGRLYLFAREEVAQLLLHCDVVLYPVAVLVSLQIGRVKVKDYGGAVLGDFVDIDVLYVGHTVVDAVKHILDIGVLLVVPAILYVDVEPVGVDIVRHHRGDALTLVDIFIYGRVVELQNAYNHRRHCHEGRCDTHEQKHLRAQRELFALYMSGSPAVERDLFLENPEVGGEFFRQELPEQKRGKGGYRLVGNIDQEVRRQVRRKAAHARKADDVLCEHTRGTLARAETVEEPRKHTAADSADNGKGQYGGEHLRELRQPARPHKERRRPRDKHADEAVVCRHVVADSDDDVVKEAHRDTRQVAADKGCENRADIVQIERQVQPAVDPCAENIEQNAAGNQPDKHEKASLFADARLL